MGGFSSNKSKNTSDSRSYIFEPQIGYLTDMWQAGQNMLQQQGGNQAFAQGQVDQAMPFMRSAMGMFGNAGSALQPFVQPDNAMAQEQVGLLSQDISRQLNENILPGLTSSAIGSGGLGGSRGAISAGLAAQGAQDAFARGSADIRNNAYGNALNASQAMGQQQLGGAAGLMEGSGAMYNLGMSPLMAAWGPLQQYAQILGSPTILNSSRGRGKSSGTGMTFGVR